MIEALLGAFELRTGRYTSPHVQSVTERISLDGSPISAERFIETYEDIKPYVEMVDAQQEYRLSFFEVLTGMAYAALGSIARGSTESSRPPNRNPPMASAAVCRRRASDHDPLTEWLRHRAVTAIRVVDPAQRRIMLGHGSSAPDLDLARDDVQLGETGAR